MTEQTEEQDSTWEVKAICEKAIRSRVTEASALIEAAVQCLNSGDYLQAAVRLGELSKAGTFTEIEFNIFDAMSR